MASPSKTDPKAPLTNADLDAEVLAVLRERPGGTMTYVIRNVLDSWTSARSSARWRGLTTGRVLRACRRLERAGKARTIPSAYAVQLCWQAVP